MSVSAPTVDVQVIEAYHALKMTWQQQVDEADVRIAFQKITQFLNNADEPITVVVDIRNNPQFPLRLTIEEARGPYKHPMLGEWLIIGSNWMAHAIERTLASVTRRDNVQWFDSEEAVNAYILRQPTKVIG